MAACLAAARQFTPPIKRREGAGGFFPPREGAKGAKEDQKNGGLCCRLRGKCATPPIKTRRLIRGLFFLTRRREGAGRETKEKWRGVFPHGEGAKARKAKRMGRFPCRHSRRGVGGGPFIFLTGRREGAKTTKERMAALSCRCEAIHAAVLAAPLCGTEGCVPKFCGGRLRRGNLRGRTARGMARLASRA